MAEEVKDLHIQIIDRLARIEQVASDTLSQAQKTNGRVTKLEDTMSNHGTRITLIESDNEASDARVGWWKDKLGTAFISLLFTVVGAAVLLVLQKTDIVDVSVVSEEEYSRLP